MRNRKFLFEIGECEDDSDAEGALVAGGNLTLADGSMNNGKVYVGGTSTLTGVAQAPVSTVKPVDVAQAHATTVDVKGIIGSVLAPYATVRSDYGVVRGNVIADGFDGYTQVNYDHTFTAVDVPGLNTTPLRAGANVPEPGSIALVLGGLPAAAAVRRRVR